MAAHRASERSAERAIEVLERAIEAARNSNQAGENFVVAAAAGLELLEALATVRDYVSDAHNGHALYDGRPLSTDMTGEDLARIDAAIAKAEGRS